MIPHRPSWTPRGAPGGPVAAGTFGGVDGGGARWHRGVMTSAHDRRPRLVALLLMAILVTGFAATVSVSAAPALPSCRVADVLTKHRLFGDWAKSLLDQTYRAVEQLQADRPALDFLREPQFRLPRATSRRRRSQAHGRGRAACRCAVLRAIGVSQLRDAEVDVRLLGPRPRLRRRPQGERPSRPQRAPARDDGRPPELRRLARPGTTRTGGRPRRAPG